MTDWRDMGPHAGCTVRAFGCRDRAEALLQGEPVCLPCADLLIERVEAVAIAPGLARLFQLVYGDAA